MPVTDEQLKGIIEEYQCPGCSHGSDFSCYKKGDFLECANHFPGTILMGVGPLFLGMPKGFDRLGRCKDMRMYILEDVHCVRYDTLNVPVWKYLSAEGHTIVRGMSPRINDPFLHIILEDCIGSINCIEINADFLEGID